MTVSSDEWDLAKRQYKSIFMLIAHTIHIILILLVLLFSFAEAGRILLEANYSVIRSVSFAGVFIFGIAYLRYFAWGRYTAAGDRVTELKDEMDEMKSSSSE